jgi:hypothetical protein
MPSLAQNKMGFEPHVKLLSTRFLQFHYDRFLEDFELALAGTLRGE